MADTPLKSSAARLGSLPLSPLAATWLGLAVVTVVLAQVTGELAKAYDARWLLKVPRELRFLVRDDISAFMKWLVEVAGFRLFTFTELTRSIARVLAEPYDLARGLLVHRSVQGAGAGDVKELRQG